MSQQPSPGPSQPHPVGQVFQPLPPPTVKQKSKTFAPGIAAGAEDVKYQAKYKELKRKVKEIEADNDKLQFKVLQAKKSINRMKIERAVLYDRLSQVPPSPEINDRQPLPPVHPGPSTHHMGGTGHRDNREHPPAIDPNDRALMDYMHSHPNVRMGNGPDGRPVPVQEIPTGPGVAPSSHLSSRHGPSVHEPSRQLPPISQMAPVQHLEPPRSHGLPHSPRIASHASSHSHSHSRSHSSSSRSRTHQSSIPYPQHAHQPPEAQSPVQHMSSPSISGERDRLRRRDGHERVSHADHYSHSRHQPPVPPNPTHSPPGTRASTRSHHQQRSDRTPLSHNESDRERYLELDLQWEYEQRQLAREREMATHSHRPPTPPFGRRSGRQTIDRPVDYHEPASYRLREEHVYHRDAAGPAGHARLSRSGTPGSHSGSGIGDGPPRPDSRAQLYDRDRARSYASRQPPHDDDYAREEHRARSRDRSGGALASSERPYPESRKRNHYEMEMDGEVEPPSLVGGGPSRKRIHPDSAPVQDADSQEEEDDMDA